MAAKHKVNINQGVTKVVVSNSKTKVSVKQDTKGVDQHISQIDVTAEIRRISAIAADLKKGVDSNEESNLRHVDKAAAGFDIETATDHILALLLSEKTTTAKLVSDIISALSAMVQDTKLTSDVISASMSKAGIETSSLSDAITFTFTPFGIESVKALDNILYTGNVYSVESNRRVEQIIASLSSGSADITPKSDNVMIAMSSSLTDSTRKSEIISASLFNYVDPSYMVTPSDYVGMEINIGVV